MFASDKIKDKSNQNELPESKIVNVVFGAINSGVFVELSTQKHRFTFQFLSVCFDNKVYRFEFSVDSNCVLYIYIRLPGYSTLNKIVFPQRNWKIV